MGGREMKVSTIITKTRCLKSILKNQNPPSPPESLNADLFVSRYAAVAVKVFKKTVCTEHGARTIWYLMLTVSLVRNKQFTSKLKYLIPIITLCPYQMFASSKLLSIQLKLRQKNEWLQNSWWCEWPSFWQKSLMIWIFDYIVQNLLLVIDT